MIVEIFVKMFLYVLYLELGVKMVFFVGYDMLV